KSLVAHTDADVHEQDIIDFLRAYQEGSPLQISELWAFPLMLRLALIEQLSHLAVEVDRRQSDHERADFWANRLLNAARRAPDLLLVMVAELARHEPNPSAYVVDRLVSQLQGEAVALDPIRAWLERKHGVPLAEIIQTEQARHAAYQVTIANAIGSLRVLSQLDWREVFEEISGIDRILADDPAGVYERMDFATRDRYRAAVEQVARAAEVSEAEVARAAVELARAAAQDGRARHVGYYLIDAGRSELEARIHYQPGPLGRAGRWALRRPATVYVGGIAVVTALVTAFAAALAGHAVLLGRSWGLGLLLLVLAAFVASELAVQVVNHLVTLTLRPRVLPKMSFEKGIPPEWRTLVVVPTLLLSRESVRRDLENLEIRAVANPDPNLHFALLADFPDAPQESMPEDRPLLELAVREVERLNARHGNRFSFFYRPRVWSASERVWMGWERKRGKLEELNRWLLGDRPGAHESRDERRPLTLIHVGPTDWVPGTRFVITLDADTQLPQGTAHQLVGTLAHPLNRPVIAPNAGRVEAGYAIIQPRVSTSLPSANATRFARLMAGPAGLDPYTHAVSDVYQDLAGEASYLGKGIYDVEAFHEVLSGRFPEATLLSHDLLEGAHVRTGLASDIELLEEFPRSYAAYSAREHRWIRGDWQIADWCTPWVPAPHGRQANPLSPLNRWKIFDNLRRSLVPPAAVGLLLIGWLARPEAAVIWSGLVGLTLAFAAVLRTLGWVVAPPGEGSVLGRWKRTWREVAEEWGRALFAAVVLPHRAALALDAIVRVWFRRLISHSLLLQWQSFQVLHQTARSRDVRFLLSLGGVSLLAVVVGIVLLGSAPMALIAAGPYLALWLVCPIVVSWIDQERRRPSAADLTVRDRVLLRTIARQTWRYFDDFVGPQTNWLPPDNYQSALHLEVAQRTSPTNIGLWLLSLFAANDFGYLTPDDLVERALGTMETLEKLERFEGHLLNWYNTVTLRPLLPRYVSTVDSGNLLACLWTVRQACRDLKSRPIISSAALQGLADTLELLQEAIANEPSDPVGLGRTSAVSDLTATLAALVEPPARDVGEIVHRLRAAAGPAAELAELLRPAPARLPGVQALTIEGDGASEPPTSEAAYWATQLGRQINAWLAVVERYLPWLTEAGDAPVVGASTRGSGQHCTDGRIDAAPSLEALATGGPGLGEGLLVEEALTARIAEARQRAAELIERIDRLSAMADDLAADMNMRFLYDEDRRLFTIGFNVEVRRPDNSYFDLLASEARLTSFVAIARGDVPIEHWFSLGRPFGSAGGRPVLLSWTGTMFEYLMPLLLMRSFEGSLLDAACREAVNRQIVYARSRGVPWGISEAAFSALDANQVYQYQAFGVPELGLKRGLEADLVVAPYATALALQIEPSAAVRNLRRLDRLGTRGSYGFFDSIDYTPRRRPVGQTGTIVCTHMAHHQGMTFLAIDNVLNDGIFQARFHANPEVQAAEPLLFERMPVAPPIITGAIRDVVPSRPTRTLFGELGAGPRSADTPTPRAHLLANGSYAVMVTGAGGGYSRWRDIDISRWRADTTLDAWGTFCYIRDVERGVVWSTTEQPIHRAASYYGVTFKPERAEFERRDVGIGTLTEVVVSPEDDVEIRRITLVNHSNRRRQLEITSYIELALAPHGADRGHPAFNKLFIQTEALAHLRALLAWRRPRSPADQPIYAMHLLVLPSSFTGPVEYETDRARFLGRGRTPENPQALERSLSRSTGYVLDPIFSLRCRVTLEPGQRLQFAFVTGAAETREALITLIEKYQDLRVIERTFELAAFHSQLELRHLRITADDVQRFLHLASHLLFPNPRMRAAEQQLRQNRLGQSRLWTHGISGDLPILLVTIGDRRDADLVSEALVAHTFWRRRGFKADLVILDEQPGGYTQPLRDYLRALIQAHVPYVGADQPGGIFLRAVEHMAAEDVLLLHTVARAVLVAARGPLVQQLSAPTEVVLPPPLNANPRVPEEPSAPLPFLELPYFNGIGGFTGDGREYAIYLGPGVQTPAPWVNIIANPTFGALISESGQGFVWYGNSQANRLLPWSNDPVSDPSGDAIYIRDDESGRFWTPTPLPVRELDAYRARHGQGYTVFEHNSHAIEQEMVTFVPMDEAGGAPVRIQRLRLRNRSSHRRRLSVIAYAEWVLGESREDTQMHVVTSWDAESQALLARNVYHPDFGSRVAFASVNLPITSYTADRTEFLGRNGSRAHPAALARQTLSGRSGAGLDPCAALHVVIELEPGQDAEVIFALGQAADAAQARALVRRFRDPEQVEEALAATRAWWDRFLGTIQVRTPVLSVDFLLNRWLLYQTLSCRLWARSAFYQSGGAYGFRDQLQDVMALVYAAPQLAREHILTAAGRQFVQGDVQHWWHPQSGAGVRTRISDDLLWLPYVTAHYVRVTGDTGILEEVVPFIEGHVLAEGEHEAYFVPTTALEVGSLLEHCRRAIDRGLTRGPHGLPLIGTGDWNDGLNRVGAGGVGESVWLAWFLVDLLQEFADLLDRLGHGGDAAEYRARAREIAAAVEEHAWDGAWYRRAYFDDGTPLGSCDSDEARIDSLPQSWAVISGAAMPARAARALQAVDEQLVREDERLILLFTPPFDCSARDPGYIKAYPPGVRENGGQYTHAAVWVALAHARRGDGDRAGHLLMMLNPIERARTPAEVERYKVEPYVVAADIYTLEGQIGRGGWTWYTGSSGWLYRVWIEEILGFRRQGDRLTVDPVIPSDWPGFSLWYRHGSTTYEIVVENPEHVSRGIRRVVLDGADQSGPEITLCDDGGTHQMLIILGRG
ncbi:MAG: hypothetical protein IRY83_06890, partial [Chloroflexi bacterium]|nr:hypothetical protein [Chloroflexota bacterium]